MDSAVALPGIWVPERPKILTPRGPIIPCPAIEELFPEFSAKTRKFFGDLLRKPLRERIRFMTGSLSGYASKAALDEFFGATDYSAATPLYLGLWTAALDDTFDGSTASETDYGSYARLSLTNNTTIFAAGSGTTPYSKTFPSDAAKSFTTASGASTNPVTYAGWLDGNAGSSADNGIAWCSVTSTPINNGDTPQVAQDAFTLTLD